MEQIHVQDRVTCALFLHNDNKGLFFMYITTVKTHVGNIGKLCFQKKNQPM